jgi:hypothetical protein
VRRTVARSRAEGALFDAVLWSVFALVVVVALVCIVNTVDAPLLAGLGIDDAWLVASSMLVGIFVAGALWWRWFKWNMHATDLAQPAPGTPQSPLRPR